MKTKILSSLVLGASLLSATLSAHAIPITYNLTGVTFTDGTAATGSFIFDADTRQSSAYYISTTAGILTAFDWTKANSGLYYGGGAGPNNFTLITFNGSRVFNFSFVNALTNAGGTTAINIASTYECYNCNPFRRVIAGSVTSNPVPEPGTLLLIAPALAALTLRFRRRRQTRT